MPFQFSLESLLRYRRSLEHQEEILLQAANQQVARVRQQILNLDCVAKSVESRAQHTLESGINAAELHFEVACVAVLRAHRRVLGQELQKLEQIRSRHVERVRVARRQRETLDSLRAQEFQLYRQVEAREEQRRSDDLFLLRRTRVFTASRRQSTSSVHCEKCGDEKGPKC